MTRHEMIQRLVAVQNAPGNEHVDIMTITGFMTDAQVEAHLARYEGKELERVFKLRTRKAAHA